MTRIRLSRIFWIGAAAVLVAAALVALSAVLRGDFSDTDGRILGTLAAALLAGSTFVAGLALAERGGRWLGWGAAVVSLPSFGLLAYAIWDFVFDGGGDSWRYGWTGALILVAALIAVTARLLARSPRIVALASTAGALATVAACVSIAAIWMQSPGDTIGKTLAALWVVTGLCYLLVPVLQRFSSAGTGTHEPRVLAELDGVELVATTDGNGIDPSLAPGEKLALRPRG